MPAALPAPPGHRAGTDTSLSDRWTPLKKHDVQMAYARSVHRFNVVPAGRRSGKTERAKRKVVRRALRARTSWDPRYFMGAPTRDQAKRLFWDDLKALTKGLRVAVSESDLHVTLLNGAQIWVLGLDKPERVEGSPWDGGILDEYGNMKEAAWPKHVRPAMSDRNGWCDFIGVPEGRNHYYDLDLAAIEQQRKFGDKSEWGHFHWISADILPPEEIAAAKRDLDELTYQQEYEGSFLTFTGRAYYPFDRGIHAALPLRYNPRAPLCLCFDFNVEPGVAAIVQEQVVPLRYEKATKGEISDANGYRLASNGHRIPLQVTGVIGEVYIPRNSNTPAVCRKIIQDWGSHEGPVRVYGDPTGGNRGTAKVMGSDWDLVKAHLRQHFGDRLEMRVRAGTFPERQRVNAVNSRLMSMAGNPRLFVDPEKAPHVVKDLEGVTLLEGGSGEIDKKATPNLTHLSDAIGYYCDREHPIRKESSVEPLIV